MAAPNAMPIRDDLQEGISYLVSRKVTNNEYAGLRDAARQKYIGAGMCPAAAEKPSGAAIDEASLAAPVFISFTFTTLGWIMAMLGGQGVFANAPPARCVRAIKHRLGVVGACRLNLRTLLPPILSPAGLLANRALSDLQRSTRSIPRSTSCTRSLMPSDTQCTTIPKTAPLRTQPAAPPARLEIP